MSNELIPVDVSSSPDLSRLVDEVERTGVGRLLQRGGRSVAVMQPLSESERLEDGSSTGYRPENDPLLDIIGALDGGDSTDVATYKDQYLADAIERREE